MIQYAHTYIHTIQYKYTHHVGGEGHVSLVRYSYLSPIYSSRYLDQLHHPDPTLAGSMASSIWPRLSETNESSARASSLEEGQGWFIHSIDKFTLQTHWHGFVSTHSAYCINHDETFYGVACNYTTRYSGVYAYMYLGGVCLPFVIATLFFITSLCLASFQHKSFSKRHLQCCMICFVTLSLVVDVTNRYTLRPLHPECVVTNIRALAYYESILLLCIIKFIRVHKF